jgi:hypothetical protein
MLSLADPEVRVRHERTVLHMPIVHPRHPASTGNHMPSPYSSSDLVEAASLVCSAFLAHTSVASESRSLYRTGLPPFLARGPWTRSFPVSQFPTHLRSRMHLRVDFSNRHEVAACARTSLRSSTIKMGWAGSRRTRAYHLFSSLRTSTSTISSRLRTSIIRSQLFSLSSIPFPRHARRRQLLSTWGGPRAAIAMARFGLCHQRK